MPKDGVKVKCFSCKAERNIDTGEVAANDFPMCDKCYMPMMPVKATVNEKKRRK